MTQLQALHNVVLQFESLPIRAAFIHDWLEDINFHSEATVIRNYLSPAQRNLVYGLDSLCIALNKSSYTAEHYQHLIERGYINDEVEAAADNYRNGKTVLLNGYCYSDYQIREYLKIKGIRNGFTSIYGYGVQDELAEMNNEQFEQEMTKLIELGLDK